MPFCPRNKLSRPPQPRMLWSAERWQWCGSLPYVARRRNGNGSDYLSIVRGLFVEVNDSKKVWGHAGLITCPDIQNVLVVILIDLIAARGLRAGSASGKRRRQNNE